MKLLSERAFPKTGLAGALAAIISGPTSAAILEEVIVTSQKRVQNIQDVGISVSAFSGEQIDNLGITNTTEIVQQVPGLQVSEFSPRLTFFNIRGVSQANFQDNLEAPVAVFVDDVYISSLNAISGQLFDVERVEVLRGPQGTLFGRNATGGLIHYLSRGADETELNGYIEAGIGNFDSSYIEAAIGGALTDSVRGRFSVRSEEADGYIEATQPGVDDLNGKDSLALRGTLQVDFTEDLSGEFYLRYSETDVPTGGYTVVSAQNPDGFFDTDSQGRSLADRDFNPFRHNSGTSGLLDRENYSTSATFDWQMNEHVTVTSITGYMMLDVDYLEDGDGGFETFPGAGFDAFPIDFISATDFTQFTQEIRFSGETDNLHWQAGVFYMDTETDTEVTFGGAPLGNVFGPVLFPPPDGAGFDIYGLGIPDATGISSSVELGENSVVDSKNLSVFGQAEFDLSDALTLIVGLRYSDDDKELDYSSVITDTGASGISFLEGGFGVPVPYFGTPFTIPGLSNDSDIDYEDWAGRIQLDWRIADETLLFASWNRGIKGGNFNVSTTTYVDAANAAFSGLFGAPPPPSIVDHDEEVLTAYEVGIKTKLTDWARLNATVFYYDYDDYQAFSTAGLVATVQNSDASNQGGEIELFLTPGEHWDIALGLSILDSEVDTVSGANVPGTTPVVLEDVEFLNAPQWSLNYLFRYNWDALGGNIALQVDGTYEDDQFLDIQNSPASEQESGGFVNARASYTTGDGAWQLTAWIKNIEDEARLAYSIDLGAAGGSVVVFQQPQTFGLTAKYNFGAF